MDYMHDGFSGTIENPARRDDELAIRQAAKLRWD
jgi:hypothetical protein